MKLKVALVTSVAVLALLGATGASLAQSTRQIGISGISTKLVATPEVEEEIGVLPIIAEPEEEVAEAEDEFFPIEEEFIEEDDFDDRPVVKKKRPKKVAEIEDLEPVFEDDDRPVKKKRVALDDEDDEPKKKKKKRVASDDDEPKKKKKKKRVAIADHDDEDDYAYKPRHRRYADEDKGCGDRVAYDEYEDYDHHDYVDYLPKKKRSHYTVKVRY